MVRIPVRARQSSDLQINSRPALGPNVCSMGTGKKRPGREFCHSSPFISKVTNKWRYTSTPPICLHRVYRKNFTFTFTTKNLRHKYVSVYDATDWSGNGIQLVYFSFKARNIIHYMYCVHCSTRGTSGCPLKGTHMISVVATSLSGVHVSCYERGGSFGSVRLPLDIYIKRKFGPPTDIYCNRLFTEPVGSTAIKQQVRWGHVPSKPQWRAKRHRIEHCFSIRVDHW
jgi:hypothetical protein